jgi:hypothetical protein
VRIAGDGEAAAARIRATLAAQGEPELARIHVLRRAEEGDRLTMPPFMQPYLRFAFAQAG